MLSSAAPPLSPSTVDGVLRLLSLDDLPLFRIALEFRQAFAAPHSAFQAATCCTLMMHSEEDMQRGSHSELAPLRPAQRLAALWLLFNVNRAELPTSVTGASPAAQQSWHLEQLRCNPFTETLLQHISGDAANRASVSYAVVAEHDPAQLHRRVEHAFLTRLLLPAEYMPASPLTGLAQLGLLSASVLAADSSAPFVQHVALKNPAALTAALVPVQQIVRDNQPHPAIMRALHPSSVAALEAEMRVSVPLLTAVLGEEFVTAVRQAEAASSSAATVAPAIATSPSSSAADDATAFGSSLTLRVQSLPPHYVAPLALGPLDWGRQGWADALLANESMLAPEMTWMAWDPPADLDWNAPLAIHANANANANAYANAANATAAAAAGPASPLTPSTAASNLATLLGKACKSQLPSAEKTQLLAELRSCASASAATSSSVAFDIPSVLSTAMHLIPPSRLPQLVEKNHEIASEFLLQFMGVVQARLAALASSTAASSSTSIPALPHTVNDYLSPLVSMDMSLHSMEVAKSLSLESSSSLLLPPDFLHLFICKCLTSCAKLQDKFLQHRHVRLICAFLTTLIRRKVIQMPQHTSAPAAAIAPSADGATSSTNGAAAVSSSASSSSSPSSTSAATASDSASAAAAAAAAAAVAAAAEYDVRDVLLVEVSSFLVEFSSHKDAANLYKLIKTMEANSN